MEYTKDFEKFWKLYPKRWNRDLGIWVKRKKWPAFEKWQKLPKKIKQRCLEIVHLIKDAEGTPRDCVTWLNQRGWEDIETTSKTKIGLPREMIEGLLKDVPDVKIDVSNERNRQMRKLKGE